MKILGIDPSLRNLGMALVNYDDEEITVDKLLLSETKTCDLPKGVTKNKQDIERVKVHIDAMRPMIEECEVVAVEAPTGSKSAAAMKSYGICIALIAMIDKPVFVVTPKQVKAASGNPEATKADMIEWATKTHNTDQWLSENGKILNKNEHLADALGAVHAALNTYEFKSWFSFLRPYNKID